MTALTASKPSSPGSTVKHVQGRLYRKCTPGFGRHIQLYRFRKSENALSFAGELKRHFDETLSVFPHAGTLHNKGKGVRKLSYKGYTAFYHVPAADAVVVLHVVHLGKPLSARGIGF
jgi:plasmid stabilization system protein ParE